MAMLEGELASKPARAVGRAARASEPRERSDGAIVEERKRGKVLKLLVS